MTRSTLVTPPLRDARRVAAITVGLGSIACQITSAFTRHWLVSADLAQRFGLRDNAMCDRAGCEVQSNAAFIADVSKDEFTSSAFSPAGRLTFFAMILAAIGLIASVGLALRRCKPDLPMSPATLALVGSMTSIVAGCVFVATRPGSPGFLGLGLSFDLFGIGAVAGLWAAFALAKVNRPVDLEFPDDVS